MNSRIVSLLFLILVGSHHVNAQYYDLHRDSVAGRIGIRMDQIARGVLAKSVEQQLIVYRSISFSDSFADSDLINALHAVDSATNCGDVAREPSMVRYAIVSEKRGNYGYFRPKYIHLDYELVSFWIKMKDLEKSLDERDYDFLSLLIQNRYGFELYQDNGNAVADSTIYVDSFDFTMTYKYLLNLELYFIDGVLNGLNDFCESHLYQRGFTGLFYDTAFSNPVIYIKDIFSQKKQEQGLVQIVEEGIAVMDVHALTFSTETGMVKITYLNPHLNEKDAIASEQWVTVYTSLDHLKTYFSTFVGEWYNGLYE